MKRSSCPVAVCAKLFGVFASACGSNDAMVSTAGDSGAHSDTGTTDTGGVAGVPPVSICDGSDNIRFSMVGIVQDGFTNAMQHANGASYLYVMGDCTYYVGYPGFEPTQRGLARTGALTANDAEALGKAVSYGGWHELGIANRAYAGDRQILDGGTEVFMDETTTVSCAGDCESEETPQVVAAMHHAFLPWQKRLWDLGKPMQGSIRIMAWKGAFNFPSSLTEEPFAAGTWPLSFPIEDVLIPRDEGGKLLYGQGRLVEQPDADKLRDIWHRDIDVSTAENPSNTFFRTYGSLRFPSEREPYFHAVEVRDVIPIEDPDTGLVPWLGVKREPRTE